MRVRRASADAEMKEAFYLHTFDGLAFREIRFDGGMQWF
jgi:hypothetical protein